MLKKPCQESLGAHAPPTGLQHTLLLHLDIPTVCFRSHLVMSQRVRDTLIRQVSLAQTKNFAEAQKEIGTPSFRASFAILIGLVEWDTQMIHLRQPHCASKVLD